MEHGKRETPSERTPRRREPRKKKRTGGNGRWSVKFIVGTVVLICFCTALMMAGIFIVEMEVKSWHLTELQFLLSWQRSMII